MHGSKKCFDSFPPVLRCEIWSSRKVSAFLQKKYTGRGGGGFYVLSSRLLQETFVDL